MSEAAAIDTSKVIEVVFKGGINTPEDVLLDQVAQNIRRGLPQAQPYPPNSQTVILVAGGASLKDTEKELVEAYWAGGKVVAINGTYQWCIDRNIKPSAFVMLDAREFNTRFLETDVEGCHYLLASQCHPKAFEIAKGRKVTMWQALSAGEKEQELLDEYFFKRYSPITLGTTVVMRAISLMRMLGFLRFDIFGLDSCWMNGEHHAYQQAENNNERTMPVWIRPRGRDDKAQRFMCSPWMAKQADDFMQLVKERGNMFQLNVRGDGLIASMIKAGAEIEYETPTIAV